MNTKRNNLLLFSISMYVLERREGERDRDTKCSHHVLETCTFSERAKSTTTKKYTHLEGHEVMQLYLSPIFYLYRSMNPIHIPTVHYKYHVYISLLIPFLFLSTEHLSYSVSLIIDAARVTYSPSIQYLPLGLSGIVRCHIQANPEFQFITWTKDRRPFDPNANPGVITLNNGSLLFQRVTQDHQGRYRCTPYNVHGTAGTSAPMEILVRGKDHNL